MSSLNTVCGYLFLQVIPMNALILLLCDLIQSGWHTDDVCYVRLGHHSPTTQAAVLL